MKQCTLLVDFAIRPLSVRAGGMLGLAFGWSGERGVGGAEGAEGEAIEVSLERGRE